MVVGTHPDWERDYDKALRSLKKEHETIELCAVNDATKLIKADHLATCHAENLHLFINKHDAGIEIHTRKKLKKYDKRENQFVWGYSYGGGSSLFAAATMLIIGYDLVVLCGCPMNGRDGYALKSHDGDQQSPRLGEKSFRDSTLNHYHTNMRNFVHGCPSAHKIRSMSGVTQKIFGGL